MEPQPTKAGWSVWDPLLIYLAAFVLSIFALVIAGLAGYLDLENIDAAEELPKVLAVLAPAQFAAMLAGIRWVSRRKGSGDMKRDSRLRYQSGDWVALLYGVGLLLAAGLILSFVFEALGIDPGTQQVVEAAEGAERLPEKLIITVVIAVLAPVAEEILFRGMLFDALLARTSVKRTVWISGVVFGLVHLIDPAALPLVPALIGLGVILGYARQRTDSLSRPILMHIGFNSVTAIGLFIAV
ncbi:MAG: type II CAAX endopeptidase family protein [Acidimicrobiia bacterium]